MYEFKTGFEGAPEKPPSAVAYVFDRHGDLLASKPLKEGSVQLDLPPDQVRTARIFFGPEYPRQKDEKSVTLSTMERLHAYEAVWKFEPNKPVYELMHIPEYLWRWWFLCSCRVRGQVLKPVTIAGVTSELPVCNARVHICEVDPIWWLIPRLPDPILIRLRDELLYEIDHPRPIPLPDPPPFRLDPGFIDPSPENIAAANRLSQPALLSPQEGAGARIMLNPQPLPPRMAQASAQTEVMKQQQTRAAGTAANMASLDLETRVALSSSSIPMLRRVLQDNVVLIHPYLCIWYWLWPFFCRCDEVAVLTTDAQGRFDTSIWYFCFGDQPDLYFWVETLVGGSWTTVYHPNPICCNTDWDYACGSEVLIRVTDPRVVPCGDPPPDLPGLQVAVLSIGQNVSMNEIPVDSTGSAPYSGTATEGLANGTNPFGGQLEPRVWFSRSALFAMGVTHYRWSYRQLTEGDGVTAISDSWHAMDRQVIRHYSVIDPITSALSFPAYPLGPDPAYPGLNLFQIQPINAPTGRPEDWAPIDAHEDLASAFFLSYLTQGGDATLGAGKYELKLELFNTSGATPAAVNLTTSGIALKVANVDAPFGAGTVTTVNADNHHRFLDGSGNTVAFRLVLHVDNNVCDSALYPISGAGLTVDADCGFIQYQPGVSAHISFMASHPHDFAMLSFSTVRGTATDVPDADAAGQLNAGAVALNGFARSAGSVFSKDVPVNTLLTVNTPAGHTPCIKAAFSEMLIVQAMATDGWQLLSYLNPSWNPKQAAYALEPA
ncbi:MAG: hypothetical protein M1140_10220 [Chloroflexi bacterium]|nr:hypothetical protein [Chloroflexota bacterium]